MVISQSYEKNSKGNIENHIIKFMETEINDANEIRFDGDNFSDFAKSLGFILVKYPDQASSDYKYIWYIIDQNNIRRYTYSDKDPYDALKEKSIKADNKNVIDEDIEDISAYIDGVSIIIKLNTNTKVIDISDKVLNDDEK